MKPSYSVEFVKREFQKAIVDELYTKGIINFCQCSNIIKTIDREKSKISNNDVSDDESDEQLTLKIELE